MRQRRTTELSFSRGPVPPRSHLPVAVPARRSFLAGALALAAGVVVALLAGCQRTEAPPAGSAGGQAAGGSASPAGGGPAAGKIVIAMMPKLINIDYFDACKRGAEAAAREIGVDLIYDGPAEATAEGQNQFLETWIRQRVSAICIAPNQPRGVKRFVEKAREAGIKVLTWDTDAPDSGRELMVNQIDDRVLGELLMDDLAKQMGEKGKWAIAIGSLDATNLNTWRRHAEARAKKYPGLELVATELTREDENFARERVSALLQAQPDLGGIIAFDSNSVPGAAEAILRAGKAGKVALVGNSTPGKMRKYVKDGVLQSFFLWDPRALGGLTVRLARELVEGRVPRAGGQLAGHGQLRFSSEDPKMVILGDPIRFTRDNVDQYDFGI